MAEYLESDPDWYRDLYCAGCRKRNERCECDMPFSEKVRGVSVNYYDLKRSREGVKAHGPHTAKR